MLCGLKVRQIGRRWVNTNRAGNRQERAEGKGSDSLEGERIQQTHLAQINMINGREQQLLQCCHGLLSGVCPLLHHRVILQLLTYTNTGTENPMHGNYDDLSGFHDV